MGVSLALLPPLASSVFAFQSHSTWTNIATLLLLVCVSAPVLFLRAHRKDTKAARTRHPDDLVGCLHILHGVIKHAGQLAEGETLRLTIHRSVDTNTLEQLVPYVLGEDTDGGGEGRKFSSRSGVVGRAFTSGQPVQGERPAGQSFDAYIHELKTVWHMPEQEAKMVSPNMFSFLAIPLQTGTATDGVLFAACSRPGFFDPIVTKLIFECQRSLVRFVKQRYPEVRR